MNNILFLFDFFLNLQSIVKLGAKNITSQLMTENQFFGSLFQKDFLILESSFKGF